MKKILALLILLTLTIQIIPVFGLAATHMSRSVNDVTNVSGPNLEEIPVSHDLSSPMKVDLSLSSAPRLNESSELTCVVTSLVDAPKVVAEVTLSNGFSVVGGTLSQTGSVTKDEAIEFKAIIKATKIGNLTIQASARTMTYEDSWLGGRDFVYVSVSENSAYMSKVPIETQQRSDECIELASSEVPKGITPSDYVIIPQYTALQLEDYSSSVQSPGTVIVKGRFFYRDRDDVWQPLRWATIWIWDEDVLTSDDYLGAALTQTDGTFETNPIDNTDGEGGTQDIYVQVLAWSSAAKVIDSGDNVYDGFTSTWSDVQDGTLDIGNWGTPTGSSEKPAWWVYENLLDGWSYLANVASPQYTMPEQITRWEWGHDAAYFLGCPQGTHYDPGGEIHLDGRDSGGHANDPDVILHEYGHAIMYRVYGDWLPPNDFPGSHTWWRHEGVNHAWMEGWACFIALAVFNDKYFTDTTQNFQINFETRTDSLSYTWDNGDDVDGNVGAALWDVFDSANDSYDAFSDGFNNIWDVVYSQRDNNFAEFYSAWRSKGKDRHMLNFCSYQNTIDYNISPALTDGQIYPLPDPIYPDTELVFWVYYRDTDHDPASIVRVYIYDDGWNYYPMDHYSGDPATGEWFYKPLSGFSPGWHDYFFYAEDGIDEDYDPDSGYHQFYVSPPPEYTITFYTNPIVGSITFAGSTYTHGQSGSYIADTYTATANPPTDYIFHHWEYGEGVYVSDINANPTTVQVSVEGWLKAVFAAEVTFYTDPSTAGSIRWGSDSPPDYTSGQYIYDANLPPDYSNIIFAKANVPSGYSFDHWESSWSLSSTTSNPTYVTFTAPGWLKAVFTPILYTVTFYTNPIADPPSITFDGTTYTHGQTGSYSSGDYLATANPPSADYAFHHWEYSGSPGVGVYVPNININPTTVEVRGIGWLKAVFSAKITFHTNPAGFGSITYDGNTFVDGDNYWEPNLPPDYGNIRTIAANPPTDYSFVSWETTGKIYVSDPSSVSTTLTVEGPGALTANFEAINQPPSILDIYPDSETESQGNTIRIYCDSSDPETPESSLTCKIWIRPSGDPWVVNGEIMSWDGNNHYYDWDIPTSAKLGYYDVNCTVFDGELSDWRIDYNEFEVVDTTPPVLHITNPTTLSPIYTQSGTTLTVDFTYTELNPKNATIRIHNATHIVGVTVVTDLVPGVDVTRSDSVNIAASATDGEYNITVTIYDVADQTGTDTQTSAVIIDNTPPTKTVISPTPGSYLDFSTVWINETLSDATSGIDQLTINMTLDGTPVTPTYDPTTGLLSYHAVGLADGNHTVAVSVQDLAGNLAINSWWFIIDSEVRVHISVSAYASPALIGFRVRINGLLTWQQNGSGIPYAPVLLSYRYHPNLRAYIPSEKAWRIISTVTTDADGSYSATWFVMSSGYYVVEAFYPGGNDVPEATSSTNLLIISSDDRVFSVSSNSTMSAINFNSTTPELTFTVSGHSGTPGYLHMFLAKSLIPDVSELKIYFDGEEKSYEAMSVDDTWFIRLTYTHSTHTVRINLGSAPTTPVATPIQVPISALLLTVLAAIAIVVVAIAGTPGFVLRRKRKTSVKSSSLNKLTVFIG